MSKPLRFVWKVLLYGHLFGLAAAALFWGLVLLNPS